MSFQKGNKLEILRRFYLGFILLYSCLVSVFYFLCGDQLLYRKSLSPILMKQSTSATDELSSEHTIKQVFMTAVERIDTVSIQWGTYYRQNTGTILIKLCIEETGEVLIYKEIDASQISEGEIISLVPECPIENKVGIPLTIEMTSTSPIGQALSPLIAQTNEFSNLYYDNVPIESAILCFSVDGTDFIKHSKYYWPLVVAVGVIFVVLICCSYYRYRKNGNDYISDFILTFVQYRFLSKQLIRRDFKAKYKRSVLGMLWSLLNPVFMMGIQYYVFSTIFKNNVEYYGVYLLLGVICFNYFSEVCNASLASIVINAGLINKVYVPKYLYTVTKSVSALINFALSMVPLIVLVVISKIPLKIEMLLAMYGVIFLVIFCMGMGLILASIMVFFRDTQFLWGLFSMIIMYATPIFYTEDILPDNLRFIFNINPLYHILKIIRTSILQGASADPIEYIYAGIISGIVLLIGTVIFKKTQDKFILYL
ncbi:MAG: ABC transporter permease [Lachnospiraceae bacterium]|nr:ABC transporter permease [Lachnospiraceae bacterium]